MIFGGGVAVLYVSTYAAFNHYRLIERPVAFVMMLGITAFAAFLADRQNSQGLAVLAVGGGFATPFMLPGNTDAQIALFTYVAILIAGTVSLARRHDWRAAASRQLRLHADDRRRLGGSFLHAVEVSRDRTVPDAVLRDVPRHPPALPAVGRPAAQRPRAMFLWTAPVAYYLASLLVLADHPMAMLVWFIGVMLVGGFSASAPGPGRDSRSGSPSRCRCWRGPRGFNGPTWLRPRSRHDRGRLCDCAGGATAQRLHRRRHLRSARNRGHRLAPPERPADVRGRLFPARGHARGATGPFAAVFALGTACWRRRS